MPRPRSALPAPLLLVGALLLAACAPTGDDGDALAVAAPLPDAPACPVMPADNYWNVPVDDLPVHARSDAYVASIGLDEELVTDFGSGEFEGGPIGIPYVTVGADQPLVDVTFEFADESDPGFGGEAGYPIPPRAPVEGGPDADGDRHVLVVDRDACVLYELFAAFPQPDGSWQAGSGAVFDLRSNAFRPDTWTSADAAGLPILPGLVRYDEVAAGVIDHAIRITVPRSDESYVWPARHEAGAEQNPDLPPMGLRLRLRPDAVAALGPEIVNPQTAPILEALQTYGAIVADNGSPWFISGVPDDRWDNDLLRTLRQVPGSAWEAVDTSSLVVDPNSGQASTGAQPTQPPPTEPTQPPTGPVRETGRLAGPTRVETAIAIAREQFPDGAEVAYLARADQFADAVAGGTLTDGPVLLVPQCGPLPVSVAQELDRLGAERVVALGGEAAVCQAMLDAAAAA